MSVCKLIHKEIQKISGLQVDHREYDALLKNLDSSIKKLKFLKKILSCESASIAKFEEWLVQKNIGIFDPILFDIVATSPAEISETSEIYVGDLDYGKYEKLNPEVKSLPDNLNIITGVINIIDSNITFLKLNDGANGTIRNCHLLESINIKNGLDHLYVENCGSLHEILVRGKGGLYLSKCNYLKQLNVKNILYFQIEHCSGLKSVEADVVYAVILKNNPSLANLTIGWIGECEIVSCPKLSLESITNNGGVEAIIVRSRLILDVTQFSENTNQEILEKFNVDLSNLIRK